MKIKILYLTKIMFIFVALSHIILCPFTKVEESFNLQAIHDILYYKLNISQFDHNQYPGVVPRTFIGALLVALISAPFVKLIKLVTNNMFFAQLVVRFVLAILVTSGLFHFCSAIRKQFNSNVEKWTLIITMSQFHFMFYMSRTLPNVFALIYFLHSAAFWLKSKQLSFIWLSAFNILVFRFELAIISGLMLLITLINRKLSFFSLIFNGLIALVLFVGLSVLVDSYFWGYWLYPEGTVLYFNTILNKSSEWGTSPFLWYFYSALPRSLLSALILMPFGLIYDTKKVLLNLFIPSIGFVIIYSFLPHKELRFIIYVIPFLNSIAAKGLDDFKRHRLVKGFSKQFMISTLLVLNLLITCCFLLVSSNNYPGGEALMKLHELEPNKSVNVHIDAFSAQTGISRFLELNRNNGWVYDKNEKILSNSTHFLNYSHLLIEAESEHDSKLTFFKPSHSIQFYIKSFNGISYPKSFKNLFVPKIKFAPKIFILKKN